MGPQWMSTNQPPFTVYTLQKKGENFENVVERYHMHNG